MVSNPKVLNLLSSVDQGAGGYLTESFTIRFMFLLLRFMYLIRLRCEACTCKFTRFITLIIVYLDGRTRKSFIDLFR